MNPVDVRTVEPFPLSLLGRVVKALEFDPPPIKLVGMHSCTPLALLLSQNLSHPRLHKNPHVIVTPDLESAEQLVQALLFWTPQLSAPILPAFDVGIYSNLYPSHRVVAQRLNWLHRAREAAPGDIFVAPIEGLLQKTLPYSSFVKSTLQLRRGSSCPVPISTFLQGIGYTDAPTVEDIGRFSIRGGIIDIYSPSHPFPYRIELFGDAVESIRCFDPKTQISVGEVDNAIILPAREVLYTDERRQHIAHSVSSAASGRSVSSEELADVLRSIALGLPFFGIDFLLPYFYDAPECPLNFFSAPVDLWIFDRLEVIRMSDHLRQELKSAYPQADTQTLRVEHSDLYTSFEKIEPPSGSTLIWVDKIQVAESADDAHAVHEFKTLSVQDFSASSQALAYKPQEQALYLKDKFSRWHAQGYSIFISAQSRASAERIKALLERADVPVIIREDYLWTQSLEVFRSHPGCVQVVLRELGDSFRLPDELFVFLKDEDVLGRRGARRQAAHPQEEMARSEALSFGDLQPGELIVHRVHGVGVYEGLKVMEINGAPAEFIELRYKDNDRLYLPVYRVGQLHKYAGPASAHMIDKLGGTSWQKTKTKVRNHLRDIAGKLLQLYSKRAQLTRTPYPPPNDDYILFENVFPYQETEDQLRSIKAVLDDLSDDHPMDRLICGDVGFGKTEVAMRAAFRVAQEGKQVALIAPTTILTHQHTENFKKRFAKWPFEIRALNRFVQPKEVKNTLQRLKEGHVDIVIGTHRLLSKDVQFKNLGLLIIDEEQKFGVTHKERLRYLRESVDTLALSATPIPRTLNMSLVGIRDLSIINTPPEDRLPTRTFICRFDPDTIRKAIESEISRGGQIFFLHNRVQTIDEAAARLREIVPHARMAIAHGQMDETLLEKSMLRFLNHELDVLICTAIIESGIDIPRANTIFIDNAHTFGVSQLYQLRGRVGRSKDRAYCYLLLPQHKPIDKTAQERLKIIQENTALGSGLLVAQYDLELRGAGDILGEDQSGHINAVGYELYMELLDETLREQKGESITEDSLEPEINLKIPALLPDKFIPDVRMRLYYYKALSNVRSAEDLDKIEQELRDQFGPPPEPVMNLLGIMLIRKLCRDLGVRDISAGKNALSLAFTEKTCMPPQAVVQLTTKENKKYLLSPDQRLKIRMNDITWPRVVDELEYLLQLCPSSSLTL